MSPNIDMKVVMLHITNTYTYATLSIHLRQSSTKGRASKKCVGTTLVINIRKLVTPNANNGRYPPDIISARFLPSRRPATVKIAAAERIWLAVW
jgi:hypothetical protein